MAVIKDLEHLQYEVVCGDTDEGPFTVIIHGFFDVDSDGARVMVSTPDLSVTSHSMDALRFLAERAVLRRRIELGLSKPFFTARRMTLQ